MWGSAVYGFFLGIAALLFIRAAPQPAGSILFWGFFAVQLTWGAVLCWRRTGLPFATLAMGIAAANSGLLAALAAAGYVFPDLPPAWWIPVGAGLLSAPLLLLIESRTHRAKWLQWKPYMERKNAWEILTGRHIANTTRTFTVAVAALAVVAALEAQQPSARQVAQERAQAELDAPKLADVLDLKPGMTVADVGAGGGAMTVVLATWLGTGHVFATDLGARQLATIREYAAREGLRNVTVLEGAAASTNLPAGCCDAIFLRHVYHHITDVAPFNRSLHASLRPGGRLAIIDFVAREGSEAPAGVPASREGHGVPPSVVIAEISAAGLTHTKTVDDWPPGDRNPSYFLVLFQKRSDH